MRAMSHQSQSSRFRGLFDAALRDYEKTTNVTLANHPIAEQLQNCHSVEPIIALLQDQARELGDFPRGDEVMKSIKNTVSVLSMLASTVALGGDATDIVRPKALMGIFHLRCIFHSHSHLPKQYKLPSLFYLSYVPLFSPYVCILLTYNCTRRQRGRKLTMMNSQSCSTLSITFSNTSTYMPTSLLHLPWTRWW
jgi:hypothetical protein